MLVTTYSTSTYVWKVIEWVQYFYHEFLFLFRVLATLVLEASG